MIKSEPVTSLVGTFWLEIATDGPNTNFQISDFGKVTYEFDLVPTDTKAAYVGGIPGALSLKGFDQMSNRGSLFGALENALGNYSLANFTTTPLADVALHLLPKGETNAANAYRFPFSLRFADIGLDERSQTASVRLSPRKTNITVGQWELQFGDAGFPDQVPILYNVGNIEPTSFNCYATGDVILNIVGGMDTVAGNQTLFETTLLGSFNTGGNIWAFPTRKMLADESNAVNGSFPEAPVIAPVFWVGQGAPVNDSVYIVGNANTIYNKVAGFAGMEGAVFGSAFGYNFYLNRSTNKYNTELTNTELASLSFQPVPRDLNSVGVSYTNSNLIEQEAEISNFNVANITSWPRVVGLNDYAALYEAWKGGSDDLAMEFKGFQPQFQLTRIIPGLDPMIANAVDFVQLLTTRWTEPLANAAFRSYAPPLGISLTNTATYRIEFDLLGVSRLKPHEVIKFDNTVPTRYQGRHYRPTSLQYDLKADRVKVVAYEIDRFTVSSNMNFNVPTSCEAGDYMASFWASPDSHNVNVDENGVFTSAYWTSNASENLFTDENGTFTSDLWLSNGSSNVSADENGIFTSNFNAGVTA